MTMTSPSPKQKVVQIALAATKASPGLCDAVYESRFVDELPGDPVTDNVPRQVRNACYTRVDPTPVTKPLLLAWSVDMARVLGVALPKSQKGLEASVLAGNCALPGMKPYAARYGGHQFGHWAGQLGDGRAITLGELVAPGGWRHELQLKGAGKTPYSRTADGRAVLRSSLREFLCSEAMFHLGIPTTRALSLAATGEEVVRDMFYDGNPAPEPGAVVCRVAPSFVRFGNFEILAAHKEHDVLRRLADYVITRHFAELGAPSEAVYGQWFAEICRRTAALMVEWMRVGFVHGVMNTDNMSILGLTIDYGPYGWLEGYDPQWTPNTTDLPGRRYCYGNQPSVAQWNLVQLANALVPLVPDIKVLEEGIRIFGETFEQGSARMLADKLGLQFIGDEGDDELVGGLFEVLGQTETDMTLFYRLLADVPLDGAADTMDDAALVNVLRRSFYSDEAFSAEPRAKLAAWLRRYVTRVRRDGATAEAHRARMNSVNPKYVARNYLAQQAIDALAKGDDSVLARLMVVLRNPYDDQPAHDELAERRPEWARHKAGCSALSCSS